MINTKLKIKNYLRKLLFSFGYSITKTNKRIFPYIIKSQFQIGGPDISFWISDILAEKCYDCSWLNDPEYFGIRNLILENKIKNIVEVGAHNGFYTLAMSDLIGDGGKIIAYEPNPSDAIIIQANANLNKRSNIEVRVKGVGSLNSTLVFDPNNASIKKFNKKNNLTDGVLFNVPIVRLDEEIKIKVDLLKIDVEGFEAEVLKGCQDILKSKPCLVIEIHNPMLDAYNTTFEEIAELAHLSDYFGFIYDNSNVSKDALIPWKGVELTPKDRVIHLFLQPRKDN